MKLLRFMIIKKQSLVLLISLMIATVTLAQPRKTYDSLFVEKLKKQTLTLVDGKQKAVQEKKYLSATPAPPPN